MKRTMDKISRETVKSLKAASMSHDEKVSFKHLPNLEMVLPSDNYTSQVKSLTVSFSPLLGEGNGNPLQYSCLENPMDGGTW